MKPKRNCSVFLSGNGGRFFVTIDIDPKEVPGYLAKIGIIPIPKEIANLLEDMNNYLGGNGGRFFVTAFY